MSLTKLLMSNSMKAASATITARFGNAASCSSFHTSSLVEDKIFLMLPAQEAKEDNGRVYKWQDHCFYDLAERDFVKSKRVPTKLDEKPPKVLGSSHGWLTCLKPSDDDFSLSLVKPSTKATDVIRDLPSLLSLPAFAGIGHDCEERLKTSEALSKIVDEVTKIVTSDPRSEDCTAVMIAGGAEPMLAFCQIGDKKWIDLDTDCPLGDVVYNSTDKKFYAIKNSWRPEIEIWDLQNPSFPKKKILKFPPIPEKLDPYRRTSSFDRTGMGTDHYLVESSGNILLVRRHFGLHVAEDGTVLDRKEDPEDQLPYGTFWFDVLKPNKNGGKFQLVNCLDDQALFLGINHSFAVSASDFPGVERNSIYFGDHVGFSDFDDLPFAGHDFGIFNLEDGSIKPCYPTESKKFSDPPAWFAPTSDIV